MAPQDLVSDQSYASDLRGALERIGFACKDGLQRIGKRQEYGFDGSGLVDGERVTVRFAQVTQPDHWSGVQIESALGLELGLAVEPKGFVRASRHIAIENDACNAEYDISGDDPAQIRALFSAEASQALHALGSIGGDVHLSDRQVEVHQIRGFLDLMPTLRGVARVVHAIKQSAAEVPPPGELVSAAETWEAYAIDNDLTFSKHPLRISGNEVAAQAMRLSRRAYESQLSVALREPLAAGLSIRPAGLLTPLVELVAGRDVQLGDARFDRAFIVKAEAPDVVQRALSEDVRRQLLELLPWGVVAFTDRGVTLLTNRHADVPAAIERMRSIAQAVDENRRGRGGYR